MAFFVPRSVTSRLLGSARYTFAPQISILHTSATVAPVRTMLVRRALALTNQDIAMGLSAVALTMACSPWTANTVYCVGETKKVARTPSSNEAKEAVRVPFIPSPAPSDKQPIIPADTSIFGNSLSTINGQQLSVGTTMGFCSGFLVKKLGKMAALAVGGGFIFLQVLESQGYIHVSWNKFEEDYVRAFDFDRDGKVTIKDARIIYERLAKYLGHNLQLNSGFAVGFALGVRYG